MNDMSNVELPDPAPVIEEMKTIDAQAARFARTFDELSESLKKTPVLKPLAEPIAPAASSARRRLAILCMAIARFEKVLTSQETNE